MKQIRDDSTNFIAFVNSQDIRDLERIHDDIGCEFETNNGYVTAVIFNHDEN